MLTPRCWSCSLNELAASEPGLSQSQLIAAFDGTKSGFYIAKAMIRKLTSVYGQAKLNGERLCPAGVGAHNCRSRMDFRVGKRKISSIEVRAAPDAERLTAINDACGTPTLASLIWVGRIAS